MPRRHTREGCAKAAESDRDVHFRQLHEPCKTPIRYRKWCLRCDREIAAEEILRGYEWGPGQYVILPESDLSRLPLPSLRTIEISQFVRPDEVDPVYFERTHYLTPQEFGEKPLKLLHRAKGDTGLAVIISKISPRSKEHLAPVRRYEHLKTRTIPAGRRRKVGPDRPCAAVQPGNSGAHLDQKAPLSANPPRPLPPRQERDRFSGGPVHGHKTRYGQPGDRPADRHHGPAQGEDQRLFPPPRGNLAHPKPPLQRLQHGFALRISVSGDHPYFIQAIHPHPAQIRGHGCVDRLWSPRAHQDPPSVGLDIIGRCTACGQRDGPFRHQRGGDRANARK
ncbi:MAG: hypothetical protein QJR06_00545 [Alicyclobacillaceae bacterium]|nr:hypothetical protein [Alicyclobacillaceae bacterium]